MDVRSADREAARITAGLVRDAVLAGRRGPQRHWNGSDRSDVEAALCRLAGRLEDRAAMPRERTGMTVHLRYRRSKPELWGAKGNIWTSSRYTRCGCGRPIPKASKTGRCKRCAIARRYGLPKPERMEAP